MTPTIYEFQFKKKNTPYYVDVLAPNVTEAVANANTIDHDFVLQPEFDGAHNGILRVVLAWDEELVPYEDTDIIGVWNVTGKKEAKLGEVPRANYGKIV